MMCRCPGSVDVRASGRHACAMAIHMNEWGVQRAPSGVVQVPLQGLMGWESAAREIGEGVSDVLLGSAKMAEEREKVTRTGELAAFSERLRTIADETRAELSDQQVGDWDYAWRAAYAPRLAEAVAELPPSARQAGRRLAELHSAQASVEALRDRELSRIGKARQQWQRRVDEAVEAGDEERATRWLRSGQDVFVPTGKMEEQQQAVSSRAAFSRWKAGLESSPLQTLAGLREAAEEGLPSRKEERTLLRREEERAQKRARRAFLERLTSGLEDDDWPDDDEWTLACRAGVISEEQKKSALAEPQALSLRERCDWQRRIDESADDEESLTALQLDVLTSALPRRERRTLMARAKLAAGVTMADRRAMSNQLWNLFSEGCFGCPGDRMALQRLSDLQGAGLPVLAEQGSEASARWVEGLRRSADCWVCFTPDKRKDIL